MRTWFDSDLTLRQFQWLGAVRDDLEQLAAVFGKPPRLDLLRHFNALDFAGNLVRDGADALRCIHAAVL